MWREYIRTNGGGELPTSFAVRHQRGEGRSWGLGQAGEGARSRSRTVPHWLAVLVFTAQRVLQPLATEVER
jgi:hypothetical protein